jgi:hypothetical protein
MRSGQRKSSAIPSDLPAEGQPGLAEVSLRLKAILDRSAAIDDHLRTLETFHEHKAAEQKARSRAELADDYIPFCDCRTVCRPVPNCGRHGRRLSQTDSVALCEIMDTINELRGAVSELATRQNEMKSELDRIRGRLC